MQGLEEKASHIQLDEIGGLQFTYDGIDYHGQLDYVAIQYPTLGQLQIQAIEGSDDVQIIYPDGHMQYLLVR